MMRWRLSKPTVSPERTASELLERIQHLEAEHAELRSRLEGLSAVQPVAQTCDAPQGARHSTPTPKRGRAGGLGRARQVVRLRERWLATGQFMAHIDREEIGREVAESEYMRHAAGGFARVTTVVRAADGTSAPNREQLRD